jgi:hypothetical protein
MRVPAGCAQIFDALVISDYIRASVRFWQHGLKIAKAHQAFHQTIVEGNSSVFVTH